MDLLGLVPPDFPTYHTQSYTKKVSLLGRHHRHNYYCSIPSNYKQQTNSYLPLTPKSYTHDVSKPECAGFPNNTFPTNNIGQPDATGKVVTGMLTHPDFYLESSLIARSAPAGNGHTGGTAKAEDCQIDTAQHAFNRLLQQVDTDTYRTPRIIAGRCTGCSHDVICTLRRTPKP